MSEHDDNPPQESTPAEQTPDAGYPGGDYPPGVTGPTPPGVAHGGDSMRAAPGHEGERASDAAGSIFDRLKSARRGTGDGGERRPALGDESSPGGEALATPPNQTDSRAGAHPRGEIGPGQAGRSVVGRGGTAGVDIQEPRAEDVDRRAERRAERWIAFWFTISSFATLGFLTANFVGDKHEQYYTPVLGVSLAFAVGGLGFGMIIWAKRLMPDEEAVQEREPHFSPPEEVEATEEAFARGFSETGFARRPLVRRSFIGAASTLGLFAILPIVNLANPKPGRALFHTHWVKGARFVTEDGVPVKLGDVSIGGLVTVFPSVPVKAADGTTKYVPQTDTEAAGDSTSLLIRLRPGENRPRKGREDWTYADHIVYSKICTHAGCPVSLYEQQTHHLLCPCHQSVFDVLDGARAIFGPASRSLPQLAISVDSDGYFIAKNGDYTEAIGPAFWERP